MAWFDSMEAKQWKLKHGNCYSWYMLSCILPTSRWLIDMVRTSSTELLTFHWTPSVPEHAPWGTYTSKQLEAVHRCQGDEKHWKNTMITPYQFVLHLAQQAEKNGWGPCSGLLTWWLIHFRSFDNLNPLVNNKKIECKHRALHQHETQFNAVSPWRLAGDHSQVQIQPWHLPAADYFNEHVPTLQGSKAQTIPDLKSKSWLCRTHLGRRMLDLQGPSRRLKRKWGQVWRNYPCVSIQAVAATATSFQRFNWTFFIGLDCSSRPAPQLRRGMMIQCTYTTSPEHPTDQPKTSILQTSRKHPKNSKAIFLRAVRRRCQSNGCGYENRGWREDHVDSFHSLVQRCAARCFVQQASLITVAQVPRILRQLCGSQRHIVALDGIRSFQAPTSEVMYQQEQLNLWRL